MRLKTSVNGAILDPGARDVNTEGGLCSSRRPRTWSRNAGALGTLNKSPWSSTDGELQGDSKSMSPERYRRAFRKRSSRFIPSVISSVALA